MKKTTGLLLLLAILHQQVNSQLSNYSFAASSGTYTPITGTPATVSALSNGVTALLPIGFTFWYNGISYTDFGASTNGKIRLGGVFTAATEAGSYTLSDHPERPILAPLFDHLRLSSTTGLTYQTTGTAPNRILTVQWAQVYWPAGEIVPAIEFQLKLYESSNRLEFIYKPLSGSTLGAGAYIGLCIVPTGTVNFRNLTNTSTNPGVSTGTWILSTKPALGQTYAFFPQLCYGPPTGGTAVTPNITICSGFNVTASVTGDTQAPFGLTYQWQSSPDGTTWTNIPSATAKTLSKTQTAATYYRRGITCSGLTQYSTSVFVGMGSVPAQYAALPYFQDFETEWISNCGNRELPSYNWRNTPLSGDRSWRRDDDYIAGGWTNNTGAPLTIGNTTHSARFHIRDEFSGPPLTSGDLDLYIDCSAAGNKELRFKHYQSDSRQKLELFYSTDGGTSFNPLAQVPGAKEWRDASFQLPSNSPTTIIRFRGTGKPFTSASDHAIDNVQVLAVNCLYPTGLNISDIQSNSAKATWNAVAGAEGYEYAAITGFGGAQAPASGTFTTSPSIVLNTLATGTSYWFHVRTKCGTGSYSSWQSIYFGTAINCSNATVINCGIPLPVHFDHGSGSYSLFETDPAGNCGEPTNGYEKLLIFKPQVTGVYSLTTTGYSGGNGVDYYIKDAAQGCAPVGWTCIGITTDPKTFSLGTLTAGIEYFILLDNFSIVNGHDETLTITCPAANPDCVSGSITPATGSICGTGTQLLTTSGGTSYQWFRNGVMINGAVQNTYDASLPGSYTVSITSGTCTKLATNSAVITQASIPGPTITASGVLSFCEGNSVTLTSSATTGHQWYKNGTLISGAVKQTLDVTTSGSYTVTFANGSCTSDPSAATTVTVYTNPAIPTITPGGSTSFCEGGNVQLGIAAGSGLSYQWLKDNSTISGANSNTYNASANGSYTIKITNANSCSAVSVATGVTVFANPAVPVITQGGPVVFCAGGSVILTSSSVSGNQWQKDGNVISFATGTAYSANSSGSYAVMVTNSDNCSATSVATVVTVNSLPAKPTISASDNVLTSSSISNNQWLLNGSPISGATGQTYTALASGVYSVQVTVNNCSSTSDTYNFVATAIVDPTAWNNEVSAFPNPTSDKLYILNQGNRKLSIRLVDTNGKTVLENNAPVNSFPLSLKKLPAGIYVLMITDIKKRETLVKTILKN